jgi:hypothetical protein
MKYQITWLGMGSPSRDRKGAGALVGRSRTDVFNGVTMGLRPTQGDMKTLNGKNGWQAKAPAPPGRNLLRLNVGQALSPANSAKKDRVFNGTAFTPGYRRTSTAASKMSTSATPGPSLNTMTSVVWLKSGT